ncbi:solid-state culture specific protein [Arthroderma uncinatum]|uniref:solid-state culture specific protein n=1 Tax=Arthroderma uncinatum TaxID=74035 RepID=UPI00144A51F7|nr:solid-state culture specific protein [Arthroderma uncinatum]KAF3481270.1 solid-state culture specific protein [Arthroderma uncinatum]
MAPNTAIVLDRTLYDLYRLDNENGIQPTLIYKQFGAYNQGATTGIKFIYNSGFSEPRATRDETTDALDKLRLRASPQRLGFGAGNMQIIVISSELAQEAIKKDEAELHRSFSQLPRDQQPRVTFLTKLDKITLEPGSLLALSRPTDSLMHLPHLADPDTHYEILSKRGLAHSGLPTPPSTVIDPLLRPDEVYDQAKLSAEVARMILPLEKYQIPFVVKLPQSAGKGTYIVLCEADRLRVKEMLQLWLQGMLVQIKPINYHLNPCSLVLQKFITGKVVALSLFVTPKGRAVFIGCCKQRFNKYGHWIGGSISYEDQDAMHKMYAGCMEKVGLFLQQKGYHGPAGIDILTTRSGEQYVIDLNVRLTGSYNLGLLTGHFTKRGLGCATLEKGNFSCSRAQFEETFSREMDEGRIIITAWTHDESTSLSYGVFIIGGIDRMEIRRLIGRVQAFTVFAGAHVGGC